MILHNSIDKLPMSVFMDCLCDKNYAGLVISSDVDVDAFHLQNAWIEIQEQYTDRMGNAEQRTFLKLLKEVNGLLASLHIIKTLIEVMKNHYTDQFAKILNKELGLNLPFAGADRPTINALLAQAANRIAGMEMNMELKQFSLEKLQKKIESTGGQAPDRKYFGTMFNIIEETLSVTMNESITVGRYCDRVQRLVNKPKHNSHGRKPGR